MGVDLSRAYRRREGARSTRPLPGFAGERAQALPFTLGLVVVVAGLTVAFSAFASALLGKGRLQRATDLAALSAARAMAANYQRLFTPPTLADGRPNPAHLDEPEYRALAAQAARKTLAANGVRWQRARVAFGPGFATTQVTVAVADSVETPIARKRAGDPRLRAEVRAVAELVTAGDATVAADAVAAGGGYGGPLAYRQGKGMRPEVARAFDRMAAAAWREAHLALAITSAYRSDAEQARLYAANPNPRWVAPPGTSLHRYGTELDLGPPAAWPWLARNARRFGFIKRYAWEAWHFGFGPNPRDREHPAQYERGSWEPPGGDHSRITSGLPAFVPAHLEAPIARAAQRWNVSSALLAAQLYAESGFNPFARSTAGALGIAQFMPATARAYGLRDPFDPWQAIDAQAHLMRDLLDRYGGKLALALAAYNAGPAAVDRYGGVPPFVETRAYVARILGLLGGVGEISSQRLAIALAA